MSIGFAQRSVKERRKCVKKMGLRDPRPGVFSTTHSSSLAESQLCSLDFRTKLRFFSVALLWHFAPFVSLKLIIKLVLT